MRSNWVVWVTKIGKPAIPHENIQSRVFVHFKKLSSPFIEFLKMIGVDWNRLVLQIFLVLLNVIGR